MSQAPRSSPALTLSPLSPGLSNRQPPTTPTPLTTPSSSEWSSETRNYTSTRYIEVTITLSPEPITPVFPTLTLSSSGNMTSGIFYSGPPGSHASGITYATGTATFRLKARGNTAGSTGAAPCTTEAMLNGSASSQRSKVSVSASPPKVTHPGDMMKAVGSNGKFGWQEASLGVFVVLVILGALFI